MKRSTIRKFIMLSTLTVCLLGFAFSARASEMASYLPASVSFSFPANNVMGYSTTKVITGKKTIQGHISSISFIGVPTGTWVSGAEVRTALFDGTTKMSSWAVFTGKNQTRSSTLNSSASYSISYRLGGKTTASTGASNTQFWY